MAGTTIPWEFPGGPITATISLDQALDATHVYQLTMKTHMNAADDSEGAAIRVSGLQSVPEPSSLLLLGPMLTGVWLRRRRRRHSS